MFDGAGWSLQEKPAIRVHRDVLRAVEAELDALRISVWSHYEVVFKIPSVCIDREIDALIQIRIRYARVDIDIMNPPGRIAAEEIICADGLPIDAADSRWVTADKRHAKRMPRRNKPVLI